jgi:protein tyrosine phosphatase (PTP) superfamily phosphohydrolase (DUF442 family)
MIVNCVCARATRARPAYLALVLLLASAAALGQPPAALPNFVAVDATLATSGQPDPGQLAALGAQGYRLVVNLAPPDARDAVADEAALVTRGGASYLNIPVSWQAPDPADFDLFSAVLQASGARKTLVHCVVNRRASLFTFLYRVVHEQVPPAEAYAAVTAVWTPEPQWRAFAAAILSRHGVDFALASEPAPAVEDDPPGGGTTRAEPRGRPLPDNARATAP